MAVICSGYRCVQLSLILVISRNLSDLCVVSVIFCSIINVIIAAENGHRWDERIRTDECPRVVFSFYCCLSVSLFQDVILWNIAIFNRSYVIYHCYLPCALHVNSLTRGAHHHPLHFYLLRGKVSNPHICQCVFLYNALLDLL